MHMRKSLFLTMILVLTACGSGPDAGTSGGTSSKATGGSSMPLVAQKLAGKWKLYNTYCGVTKTDDGTGNVYLEFSDAQAVQYGPQGCSGAQTPTYYYTATFTDTGRTSGTISGTLVMSKTQTLSSSCPDTYSAASGTTTYNAVYYTGDDVMELDGDVCSGSNHYVSTYIRQ